jgi:hypothetical protein
VGVLGLGLGLAVLVLVLVPEALLLPLVLVRGVEMDGNTAMLCRFSVAEAVWRCDRRRLAKPLESKGELGVDAE